MKAVRPSDPLAVLAANRRLLYWGLLVSLLLHLVFVALYFRPVEQAEEEVVIHLEWQELDTPLLIPPPQLSREFAFKKQVIPKGTPIISVQRDQTATVVGGFSSGLGAQLDRAAGRRWSRTRGSRDFIAAMGAQGMGLGVVGVPQFEAVEMTSLKEPERRIDMQAEFLDLAAIDTGKYRGMVIQDPADKRNIEGFVYLGLAWGSILQPSRQRSISQLVRAINQYTRIEARVIDQMFIDSQDLFKAPFVYITTRSAFELTEREMDNLGKYLRNGGFLVADNDRPELEYGPAEASLRDMFRQALGRDARFVPIPNEHPLYHVFFDFDDGPPPGGEELSGGNFRSSVYYLEGIFLGDRLVAVYSDKGYGAFWERESENEPHLKLGVNMVVFALTQKGSIAQQQIDFYNEAR